MSRLDSMIRRLEAQRDGIAWGAAAIAGLDGAVLEIGLGNGRTYDHLRETLPGREIWVIERAPNAHPRSTPPSDRLLVMEAEDAFAALSAQGISAALVHYDLGIGVAEVDRPLAERLSPGIAALMRPGAVALANNPLLGLTAVEGPAGVRADRYYFYQKPKS